MAKKPAKKNAKKPPVDVEGRIVELRSRIHEIYTTEGGPRSHANEIDHLSRELTELMFEYDPALTDSEGG